MKIIRKAALALLTFAICFSLSYINVSAQDEGYTYTVTFYAGNQGSFINSNGLSVRYNNGSISVQSDKITVSGLKLGDIVSFDAQAGAVDMGDASKYYIKGIRESGRDNSTVTASAFKVSGDADYVTAYGIKGDTVAYVVNYQDQAGNTLAPSKTYYGNVGDKAVAAYLYIEGYTPQALAMAKTLSSNEAENVITFVYIRDEESPETNPPVNPPTNTPTGTITPAPNPAGGNAAAGGGGTAGGAAAGGAGAGGAEAPADDAAGGAEAPADNQGEAEDGGETVDLPDDNVPLQDQELQDLDDENPPLENIKLDDKKVKKGLPLAAYIGMGVAAAAGLIVLIVALKKRRKPLRAENKKSEKDEE